MFPTGGGQIDATFGGDGGFLIANNSIGPGCGRLSSGIELHRAATVVGNTVRSQRHHGIVAQRGASGALIYGNTIITPGSDCVKIDAGISDAAVGLNRCM